MASCRLCTSFGRTKIQYSYDLVEEHAKSHFLQMKMIEEEIVLDQIYEKCFPRFETIAIDRTSVKDSSSDTLKKLCRSVFNIKDGEWSPNVQCEKCGSTIKIRESGSQTVHCMIDHACNHLGQNLYECRLCSREFSTKNAVGKHLAKKHKKSSIGNYNDRHQDYVQEIALEIKLCFSACKREEVCDSAFIRRSRSNTKSSKLTSQRRSFCHELISKYAAEDRSILCILCSKRINTDNGNARTSRLVMDHALLHLQKPTWRCKICSELYSSRGNLGVHTKAAHALFVSNNYERLDDQYHSEIMSTLSKCYDKDKCGEQPKRITMSAISESDVLRCLKGSKLAAERQLLCNRLVRNLIDNVRKVECQLCSKRIGTTNGKGAIDCHRILQHALVHLKKPFIQCRICSKEYSSRAVLSYHLKEEHALPFPNNAISLADNYHEEIMSILRACYGSDNTE